MADLASCLEKNKALWTRVYDEVIAPEVETEWKRRSEQHEKELKTKDENQQILFAHVNDEIIKNARLREENERLKKLLQRQSPGATSFNQQSEITTSNATVPMNEYRCITDKYDELNKRYQDSVQRLKYLERKNVSVMQKNKEMKDSVRAWQEYCDRHLGKQKVKSEAEPNGDQMRALTTLEASDSRPGVPSSPQTIGGRTPRSLLPLQHPSTAPMTPLANVTFPQNHSSNRSADMGNVREDVVAEATIESAELEEAEQHSPSLWEQSTASHAGLNDSTFSDHTNADRISSSQTTEDEVAFQHNTSLQNTNPMDNDDIPEVVSTRSLKRKRMEPPKFKIHTCHGPSDGTLAKPIRVKEERFSSPPLESVTHQLSRKETMDLDELGPNVVLTPRRRLKRTHSIHSNVTGTLRNQRSNSAPFADPPVNSDPRVKVEHTEGPRTTSTELGDLRSISEPNAALPLSPLDPNVLAKPNEGAPNKRIRREELRQQEKFHILAESGESLPHDENAFQRPPNLARAHLNERLRASKNAQTPMKNMHSTPKVSSARATGAQAIYTPSSSRSTGTSSARWIQRKNPSSEPRTRSRPAPTTDGRPIWTMTNDPLSEPTRKAAAPPKQEEQAPLRRRALDQLTVQDFKPNPKYNQGYTHAFAETVRNRADRMCLPGCTDPSCCGSTFRTLASALPPLSPSSATHLLRDYLGDAYDSFGLSQMEESEKEEIVLQARTRQLAKEAGKHRERFEGRRSPPGFWRVDFADTQERRAEREEAREMERGLVRERWLEAMRGGGRWIFRDE